MNVGGELGSGDAGYFSTSPQVPYQPATTTATSNNTTTTQQLTPQTPNTPTIILTGKEKRKERGRAVFNISFPRFLRGGRSDESRIREGSRLGDDGRLRPGHIPVGRRSEAGPRPHRHGRSTNAHRPDHGHIGPERRGPLQAGPTLRRGNFQINFQITR